jgi:lysophospholipase L1-like esterase
MRRLLWSVSLWCLPLSLLQAQPDPQRWEKAIRNFEKLDKARSSPKADVVFTGSSSIAGWKNLESSFSGYTCLNRGFGGSQLTDVNHYLDRIVTVYTPRTVVLFCGGNDLAAGRTPEQVHEAFQTFVSRVHRKLPDTRIIYLSIHLPPARVKQQAKIQKTNALIAATCKKNAICFVDTYALMLGSDGRPNPALYRDSLHPNPRAYQLWVEELEPLLLRK